MVLSVTLVAETVYTPALDGAVSTTAAPEVLVAALKEPPLGLMLQRTPAVSLVVAVKLKASVVVKPAWIGLTVTVIGAVTTVRLTFAAAICAGLPESLTVKPIRLEGIATVGAPEMTPVAGTKDSPAGKAPLAMLQV